MKSGTAQSRVRVTPKHRTFRLSKKRLKQHKPVPGAIKLFKDTFTILGRNKRLFAGIVLLNAIFSFIFIQGLGSSFNIVELKQNFNELLGGENAQLETAVALFGYLIGTAGSNVGDASGVYQLFLTLITALALIWAVRQIQAGEKPGIRDSYYKGMYPLIPFILVLFVISLQLIPLLFGNLIFSTVMQNGLAVTLLEKAIWLLLFGLLALLSAYMLISSLFSLYIVTLPDMTPLRALRSARELVLHRRLAVALRIIALPVALSLLAALIFIPLLIVAAPIVEPLFLIVTSAGLAVATAYMYLLYRSLL